MHVVHRHTCRQILTHSNKPKSLKSNIQVVYHPGFGVPIVPLALSATAHLVRPVPVPVVLAHCHCVPAPVALAHRRCVPAHHEVSARSSALPPGSLGYTAGLPLPGWLLTILPRGIPVLSPGHWGSLLSSQTRGDLVAQLLALGCLCLLLTQCLQGTLLAPPSVSHSPALALRKLHGGSFRQSGPSCRASCSRSERSCWHGWRPRRRS